MTAEKEALILVGSGHLDSTCYKIARLAADCINENVNTGIIQIPTWSINECLGCEYCLAHQNKCVIQDDMQKLYPLIDNADYLIFISPVYFSNIPATLKKVIDRCQLYFNLKDKSGIKPKKFLAIHIGGAKGYEKQFESFENTYKVLLPDFKAAMSGLIHYSGTDRQNPMEDIDFINNVKTKLQNLIN